MTHIAVPEIWRVNRQEQHAVAILFFTPSLKEKVTDVKKCTVNDAVYCILTMFSSAFVTLYMTQIIAYFKQVFPHLKNLYTLISVKNEL